MTVNIGHLHRKRMVRNLKGQIIDWTDETDGGDIIRKGRVVNQEKIDEEARKEEDRRTAAQAITAQVSSPHAEERTVAPTKMQELEKKVEGMESKLDAILAALKK